MKKKVAKKTAVAEGWKTSKKDQYAVVLEDLRSNFKAFGENLDFVRKDLKDVKSAVESHTQMIGRIMIDIEEIKSGMREKVDRRDFVKLEKRLVVLEATVCGGRKKP